MYTPSVRFAILSISSTASKSNSASARKRHTRLIRSKTVAILKNIKTKSSPAMTATEKLKVLFEDNHLLVVLKEPDVLSQGTLPGIPTCLASPKSILKTNTTSLAKYTSVSSIVSTAASGLDGFRQDQQGRRQAFAGNQGATV